MIVVDSSVWIDYFNGVSTPQTDRLDGLLGVELVAIGDVTLVEVLQGFRDDRDHALAREVLVALPVMEMLGTAAALRCADAYRALRRRGVTVRKTIDVIIAVHCITHGHRLLFSDRDFQPFVDLLGLAPA